MSKLYVLYQCRYRDPLIWIEGETVTDCFDQLPRRKGEPYVDYICTELHGDLDGLVNGDWRNFVDHYDSACRRGEVSQMARALIDDAITHKDGWTGATG